MRVAVIGVGNMGRNHLRVYGTLKHVDLVGVYDADSEVAAEAARQLGQRCVESAQPTRTRLPAGVCGLRIYTSRNPAMKNF